MAQIDTSIPMGFRPIQIESPVNQMAALSQLQGLQQQQQMNALKMQEYQQQVQDKNELARIMGDPNLEYGSDNFMRQVLARAPSKYEEIATRVAQREDIKERTARREYETAKLKAENKQRQLEEYKTAQKDVAAFESIEAIKDDIDRRVGAGLLPVDMAANILAGLPTDNANLPAWKKQTLMKLVTAEKQLELQDKSDSAAYADYLMDTVINNPDAKVMSKAEFMASRNEAPTPAAPAVAPAAAPASADATVTTPPEAGTTVSAEGVLLAPGVAELYAADNPRAKAMADILQRRFEDKIKSQRFTGEFANVDIAEDRIAELKKRPQTPEVVAKIASLQEMVSTAKKGKAPKIDVIVGPQEKEFEKELGKGQAKDLIESRTKAEDARDILSTVKIGRDILKSGVITGAGADFFVGLNQALKTAGVDMGYADAAANSQAYAANMANNVGKLIKQFGAGTGLSDSDRKYAEQMAGGRISLDRIALEKILGIQDRAARNVISYHNQKVKGVKTNIPLAVELDETAAPPAAPKPKNNIRSKADAILGK